MIEFNWDKYFHEVSLDDFIKTPPFFDFQRTPSTFNPEKTMYYSSSLDIDVAVDNIDEMNVLLNKLRSEIHGLIADGNFYKAAMVDCDIRVLESLINQQS